MNISEHTGHVKEENPSVNFEAFIIASQNMPTVNTISGAFAKSIVNNIDFDVDIIEPLQRDTGESSISQYTFINKIKSDIMAIPDDNFINIRAKQKEWLGWAKGGGKAKDIFDHWRKGINVHVKNLLEEQHQESFTLEKITDLLDSDNHADMEKTVTEIDDLLSKLTEEVQEFIRQDIGMISVYSIKQEDVSFRQGIVNKIILQLHKTLPPA
jgi:hypothetical protein